MIELAGPVLGPEEKQAVLDVLDSGWLTMGEKVRAFERKFADMHGGMDALGVNSCTSALHLALLALGITDQDEVIVPTVTFVATVNAVLYTGARPVMADITDPAVPLLLPENAAPLVGPRTRAVVVVHYGGYEADMAAWRAFCDRHGLYLVVDAAHATGAAFAARDADAACFSFFPNKNMTTAEGGMLLARDPEVLARARGLRSHGMTTLTLERHKGHAYSYDVTMLGHNYRLDEIRAALGMVQLDRLPAMNARRAELSALYRELLEHQLPQVEMTFQAAWPTAAHLVTVLLPEDADRLMVMKGLRERKVQSSIHYPPVHLFTCHRDLLGDVSLPVSEEYCRRTLTLPLHPGLSEEDVAYVVDSLDAALRD
ncbi:MAG: DegT/DnrJ/EryC1/StrS aminotransferase family protein [Thermodesulfobacteriota bacterium]